MSHPFAKIFEKALKKSVENENVVLHEALKLREKGYSNTEILTVLTKLQKALIDEREEAILKEAVFEFEESS